MRKASEYRRHAIECRQLAVQMDLDEQRQQMLGMAAHWEQLASDRVALITRYPELAHPGEIEEERQARPG